MRARPTNLAATVIVAVLGVAGPAPSAGISCSPSVRHTQAMVSYISGGIGEEEAALFKREAATYPLEILFVQKARPRDEYLADVRVAVRNRSGNTLLETTTEGPFLLARLPPGKYDIEAEIHGERKHQTVEIRAGKHQRAVFVWARRDESELPVLSSAD